MYNFGHNKMRHNTTPCHKSGGLKFSPPNQWWTDARTCVCHFLPHWNGGGEGWSQFFI